jgi:hypothetical protein
MTLLSFFFQMFMLLGMYNFGQIMNSDTVLPQQNAGNYDDATIDNGNNLFVTAFDLQDFGRPSEWVER